MGSPQGYGFRPATLDDLEAAVKVFNACSLELIGVDQLMPCPDL